MSNNDGAKAPLTSAERQREYRRRKAESVQKEVRGIYATESDEKVIKEFAKSLRAKKN